jgi:hypothetical protein
VTISFSWRALLHKVGSLNWFTSVPKKHQVKNCGQGYTERNFIIHRPIANLLLQTIKQGWSSHTDGWRSKEIRTEFCWRSLLKEVIWKTEKKTLNRILRKQIVRI